MSSIAIDDRKGRPNRLEEKVRSIEKGLGKTLKKWASTEACSLTQGGAP